VIFFAIFMYIKMIESPIYFETNIVIYNKLISVIIWFILLFVTMSLSITTFREFETQKISVKGISPLFASALLIAGLFTVGMMTEGWVSTLIAETQTRTGDIATESAECASARIEIRDVYIDPASNSARVSIRNSGFGDNLEIKTVQIFNSTGHSSSAPGVIDFDIGEIVAVTVSNVNIDVCPSAFSHVVATTTCNGIFASSSSPNCITERAPPTATTTTTTTTTTLPPSILGFQVEEGDDDAHEKDDGKGFKSTSSDVRMDFNPDSSKRWNSGFRFTNMNIPQGSTIVSAILEIYVIDPNNDDPNVDIFANDVDDAEDFEDEKDVTSRARTTTSVRWTATGTGSGFQSSPNIATVVQEVIDRTGWTSGNALVILVDGTSEGKKRFQARAYDGNTTQAAKLNITYTPP